MKILISKSTISEVTYPLSKLYRIWNPEEDRITELKDKIVKFTNMGEKNTDLKKQLRKLEEPRRQAV